MKIDYAVQCPDQKHCLRVGLRYEVGVDGVATDEIREIVVRKSHFNSLTVTQKKAYAVQCAEYHHPIGTDGKAKREARRTAWDADDKAKSDAAAEVARLAQEAELEAARLAQEAIFDHKATGFVKDRDGNKTGITATVNYHGLMWSGTVPYTADAAVFKASLEEAFAAYETAVNAEKAELAALVG